MPPATKVLFSLHGDPVLISNEEDEERFLQRLIEDLYEEDVVVEAAQEEEQPADEAGPSNSWGDIIILDDSDDEDIPVEDIQVVYEEGHVVPPADDAPAVDLGDDEDPDMDIGIDDLDEPVEEDFVDNLIPIGGILDGEPLDDDDGDHIDWDAVPVEDWPEDWPEGILEEDLLVEAEEMLVEGMEEPEMEEQDEEPVGETVEVAPGQSMEHMMWEAMVEADAANALAQQYATALAAKQRRFDKIWDLLQAVRWDRDWTQEHYDRFRSATMESLQHISDQIRDFERFPGQPLFAIGRQIAQDMVATEQSRLARMH